jgi:hypothetical protein
MDFQKKYLRLIESAVPFTIKDQKVKIRFFRFNRSDSGLASRETPFEREFLDSIRLGKVESIQALSRDSARRLEMSRNWEFVKRCAKESAHTDDPKIVRSDLPDNLSINNLEESWSHQVFT